ncbi:MAG: class I tRNA ligase family protein, partial [Clostridia bacterium]|nr:class I tRNA ligase family protein [Clostridia bacterium]
SSDYHADIRISKDILKQLTEAYRKIRNTARFILGCIGDFDPDKDAVSLDQLEPIDKWALNRLDELNNKCKDAFDKFEYHIIFHAIHNFCVVDMSNFYLDVLKDRLYVEKADSETRRAAQTTIYKVLDTLTLLLAPIISFTANEIWQFMPHDASRNAENVILNDYPSLTGVKVDNGFAAKWEKLHNLRDDVKKAIENARNQKIIGASLDSEVELFANGETLDFLKENESVLPEILIVSSVKITDGDGGDFHGDMSVGVTVRKAGGEKCERCWSYSDTVGSNAEHATLCARCAKIISE